MSNKKDDWYDEVSFRCIVDSSELDISNSDKVKFTYTDYEKLQNNFIEELRKQELRTMFLMKKVYVKKLNKLKKQLLIKCRKNGGSGKLVNVHLEQAIKAIRSIAVE